MTSSTKVPFWRVLLRARDSEDREAPRLRTPVSIRQHTSAYVSIRQHTYSEGREAPHLRTPIHVYQDMSAYVSIRQHTSAYVFGRSRSTASANTYILYTIQI